ncbi:orf y [Abeliophyllum distichum]|uniref:Orf y n=1 Tax=Abeliophyllum distichum TaxID=126358 RepID=A0ABD1PBE4_9LAMI
MAFVSIPHNDDWKYFKKYSKPTGRPKKGDKTKDTVKKFCPQNKKNCRCWLCNESGHYANECPARLGNEDRVRLLTTFEKEGFYPVEDPDDTENLYYITTDSESDSEDSAYNHQMMNKNITNPNFIYIPIKLSFEGYRKFTVHAYIDTENPLDPKINKGTFTAKIELLDEHKGKVVRAKAMAYSPKDREEFAVQIKELLDLQVIEPSKSPFSSPAFMVRKEAEKRRGKARMVIDYSQLNKVTKNDGYILPNMQSLLQLIKGKKIFSSFDCKSGFHQVRFEEETKPLTAFSCPQGHFQWTVVPFGLKQAPGIFQRHMDNTFKSFNNFCCVYIDDILVFSDSDEDHEKHVLQILQKIQQEGIVLSKKKAELFKEKIGYLGLDIAYGFKQLKPHILSHIQEFLDEIQDQKQLMRLLGCLTYAESFIQDLAKMRTPLQKKLKKDHKWNWTKDDSNYVRKIKAKLKNLPPLYHPHKDDKMIIETDASQEF